MGNKDDLTIPSRQFQTMLQHLEDEYPLEGCGLMAGNDGVVTAVYPIDNILKSPTAYEMDSYQQVHAMLAIEQKKHTLIAIYHSHPNGPTRPSATDIAQAYYPQSVYIIVSFATKNNPQIHGYNIVDGLVSEIKVSIH